MFKQYCVTHALQSGCTAEVIDVTSQFPDDEDEKMLQVEDIRKKFTACIT